jgi:hypothetical protein
MKKQKSKFLNLGSSIKANMLCAFFSSYVFMDERKESRTPNTSNLMLEARLANSKEIPESSFIRDSKEGSALTFSLVLELIMIVEFKVLDNSQ